MPNDGTSAHLIEVAHCGYTERAIDPNLTAALDKLGEEYGPLGVAVAAAVRTEPQMLMTAIRDTFSHQRDLWDWLVSTRYTAEQSEAHPGRWFVIDTHCVGTQQPSVVATIDSGPVGVDAEDTAHAMADHLDHKITLARIAQAVTDRSVPGASA
jgi:hypothetical protein